MTLRSAVVIGAGLFVLAASAQAQPGELAKQAVVLIRSTGPTGHEQGSGFVYETDGASVKIVTASHVVAGFSRVEVEFRRRRGERFKARLVESDRGVDIALIVVEDRRLASEVRTLLLGDSSALAKGQPLHGIGHPRRARTQWAVQPLRCIGQDGTALTLEGKLSGGFSGGPLLDSEDRVVGMLVEEIRDYGKALPVEMIHLFLREGDPISLVALSIEGPESGGCCREAARSRFETALRELGVEIAREEEWGGADLRVAATIGAPERSVGQLSGRNAGTVRVSVRVHVFRAGSQRPLSEIRTRGKDTEFYSEPPSGEYGNVEAALLDALEKALSHEEFLKLFG